MDQVQLELDTQDLVRDAVRLILTASCRPEVRECPRVGSATAAEQCIAGRVASFGWGELLYDSRGRVILRLPVERIEQIDHISSSRLSLRSPLLTLSREPTQRGKRLAAIEQPASPILE